MRLRETALPETFSAFRRGGTLGRPYFLVLYTFLQLYRGDPCGRPWEYELRSKRAPSSVWPTASHLPPCRGKAILHRERWLRKPRRSAEGVPRNGVRGKATMGTKCPSEPSPAAFWLLCRRGQSNPLSADSGIPPAKNYGPLITLGLQNHFHSLQPR